VTTRLNIWLWIDSPMSIEIALQALEEKLEPLERILRLFAASLGSSRIRNIKSDDGRGFRCAAALTSMRVQPKRMGSKARIISLLLSVALGSCANANNPPTGFTADSGPSRTVIPAHCGQRSGDCGQFLMSV